MKSRVLIGMAALTLAAGCAPAQDPDRAPAQAPARAPGPAPDRAPAQAPAPAPVATAAAASVALPHSGSFAPRVRFPAPGLAQATVPAPAASAPSPLVPLLSGFEYSPTREALEQAVPQPGTVAALLAVYRDPAQRLDVRSRALVSLRFFAEPAAEAALREAATDPATPAALRRPALKAYATGFAASALPVLQTALRHADPHTRDAALRMLLARGPADTAAAQLAASHCTQEPDAAVRLTCSAKGLATGGER